MQFVEKLPKVKCGNPNCDKMVPVRDKRQSLAFCNRICESEYKRYIKTKGARASTFGQI